jgi:hypothetical protein
VAVTFYSLIEFVRRTTIVPGPYGRKTIVQGVGQRLYKGRTKTFEVMNVHGGSYLDPNLSNNVDRLCLYFLLSSVTLVCTLPTPGVSYVCYITPLSTCKCDPPLTMRSSNVTYARRTSPLES